MTILGIDTSCDETAIAVLKAKNGKLELLSNTLASQVKIHQKYGGVYPTLAKREHHRNLPIVLKKALKKAGFAISNFQFPISKQIPKLDLIAVTVGPGLDPCLWEGVNFAKELAKKWGKSIIPVNHIEAHIAANFIGENSKSQIPMTNQTPNSNDQNLMRISLVRLPAICLVVSGGHTQLILMKKIGKYKIIGETRDDAAGECFDKTARILGLPYPGGPALAQQAGQRRFRNIDMSKYRIALPRPMIHSKDYDFSFSGLKTAVLYDYRKRPPRVKKSEKYIGAMAKEIQQAIIDVLIKKTIKAAKDYKVKTIILGGGVAANNELRRQLKVQSEKLKVNFLAPPKKLCTDNGLMIAAAGYFNRRKATQNLGKIKARANLRL